MRSSTARIVFSAVLVVLILYTLYELRHALLIIYIATLLAILFEPGVRTVRRLRLGRWQPGRAAATAIVSLCVIGILVLIGTVVVPPVVSDATRFAGNWPSHSERLFDWIHRHVPFTASVTPDSLRRTFQGTVGRSTMLTIGASVLDILTTLLIGVYLLAQGPRAFAWTLSLAPEAQRARLGEALQHGARRTQHWVAGQGLLMLIHGGSAFVTFWLIGLPYFTALGVFAGVINVIPVLGPILTLVAAGLIAAIDAPGKLVGVVIFYLVYHNVEGVFLQPRIMSAAVGIPAVAVVLALVIGDEVAGIVGMAFSVPTAVLVAELKNRYLG